MPMQMNINRYIALLLAVPRFAAALSLSEPVPFPLDTASTPDGLSGIAYTGDELFFAVNDSGATAHPAVIVNDPHTGAVSSCVFKTAVRLSGKDLEGIAFDAENGTIWVSDETGPAVRGFSTDGTPVNVAPVPGIFKACRNNLSLESLTIGNGGNEMWTANEEALHGKENGIDDGPAASKTAGSIVRLQKFVRENGHSEWTAAEQYAYTVSPAGGDAYNGIQRSGLADLCLLCDGRLLALEREFSVKTFSPAVKIPCCRTRIFLTDFSRASCASDIKSLNGSDLTSVSKKLLFEMNFLPFNFEGICLGPALDGGGFQILLIADGDSPAPPALMSLRLDGLDCPDGCKIHHDAAGRK